MPFAERAKRFRTILPIAQLLVCLLILGKSLPMILHMTYYSIHIHALDLPEDREEFFPTENTASVVVARVQSDQVLPNPLVAVSMLNLPALVVQFPISLLASWPDEWIPRGYFGFLWIWRATSWPLIGSFFWYLVGRALDSCMALRHGNSAPRMTRRDLCYSIPLVIFSLGFAVYARTANDFEYLETNPAWLSGAGVLWAVLFAVPVLAFYLQRRATKHASAAIAPAA